MPDLPAAWSTKELHLPHAVGWEIVMEHKLFVIFAHQRFNFLLIGGSPQRGHYKCLGFSTGKEGRSMGTRENPDFTGHWTNILETPTVNPNTLLHDEPTEVFRLNII